ncbi:MAG: dihydrofolate reductase [Bacteroidales bacterium]|nr:dihydrofolate reductase [Bacteroidales bacterium]
MKTISIIVAIDKRNAIGNKGDQLAYIREDLRRFKQFTTGHTIVMGRRTAEALPKGALPNRKNVVLSRSSDWQKEGFTVVKTIQQAIDEAADDELYVIGGGEIYNLFIQSANRLIITEIDYTFDEADTYFPTIDKTLWHISETTDYATDEKSGLRYRYVTYER